MMERRRFLRGAGCAGLLAAASGRAALAEFGAGPEFEAEALKGFPFEHVVTPSSEVFAKWKALKSPSVAPVIIGAPKDLAGLAAPFHPGWRAGEGAAATLEETLARADALQFPADLKALREKENAAFQKRAAEETPRLGAVDQFALNIPDGAVNAASLLDAPLGYWPDAPHASVGDYTPPVDFLTGQPIPEVAIILVPTDDPTTIPAHLRWGGWNSNPPAEFHVAALRSWGARYGAELVSLSRDTMELRVASRPTSRDEALDLAREQYWYCSDIILQGLGDLSSLAATLTASEWWGFWWD